MEQELESQKNPSEDMLGKFKDAMAKSAPLKRRMAAEIRVLNMKRK